MSCQNGTTTNPAPISIEPGTTIHVICMSHAAFFQQVILSFNQSMTPKIGTFSGTGENVPMRLDSGQTVLTAKTGGNSTLWAQFNFSQGGPFTPAKTVCAPVVNGQAPNPVFTSVTSEDSSDNDNNDSYLTIIDLNTSDKSLVARGKVKVEAREGNYASQ